MASTFVAGVIVGILLWQIFFFVCTTMLRRPPMMAPMMAPIPSPMKRNSLLDNSCRIYAITVTCRRSTQAPDLVRISQTLRSVPNIFWIIYEVAPAPSQLVQDILSRSQISHRYMHVHDRRNSSRSCERTLLYLEALEWLRKSITLPTGTVIFINEQHVYHHQLFREIRCTRSISVFPVGLEGTILSNRIRISTPILKEGKVVAVAGSALFLSGTAFSLRLLQLSPTYIGAAGERFLNSTSTVAHLSLSLMDLVPVAKNCTQILTWNTQTNYYATFPHFSALHKSLPQHIPLSHTNLVRLYRSMSQ
ncbi:galactosylgalactosylxylosylprotein 3-beta-glucuronosyltransferase 3-like isoform X1 [Ornithodoros turicata]|uniref:galactosylgalactosylxylosylprotein 3-beta-glucuronosyltransferase 3-like isoform X1 n=1 Tax=Ornithodoros turicata TaxID=34597 RepID=UPI00313A34BA